jgi:hypothetical protein
MFRAKPARASTASVFLPNPRAPKLYVRGSSSFTQRKTRSLYFQSLTHSSQLAKPAIPSIFLPLRTLCQKHPGVASAPPAKFFDFADYLHPNPLESALPQNQISHSANPIESTPFSRIARPRTNSAPVTPASTTLTKHTPRNPIRMNTSTKHQAPPHPTPTLTNLYSMAYTSPLPLSYFAASSRARSSRPCRTPSSCTVKIIAGIRYATVTHVHISAAAHCWSSSAGIANCRGKVR